MSTSDSETDWPIPSVAAYTLNVPGKGNLLTLSGNEQMISAYLRRYGCVPVFGGTPRRRKLARLNVDGQWELYEPDGTSELEAPQELITGVDNQLQYLVARDWYHVGYNVHRELIEFVFGENGNGFSRYTSWGYGTAVPTVRDYYWDFNITDKALAIKWEDEGTTHISFTLSRALRAASSLADGGLAFYDGVLNVEGPLFPPSAEFSKYLLKEYWGKPKERGD